MPSKNAQNRDGGCTLGNVTKRTESIYFAQGGQGTRLAAVNETHIYASVFVVNFARVTVP